MLAPGTALFHGHGDAILVPCLERVRDFGPVSGYEEGCILELDHEHAIFLAQELVRFHGPLLALDPDQASLGLVRVHVHDRDRS